VRIRNLVTAVLALGLALPAMSSAADPQLMAPIQRFVDSFNKGDAAGAAATHSATDDLVIVDEVPPYVWRGAKAFSAWAADLEAYAKKHGQTDQSVAVAAPTREETDGQQAYVVVPVTYTLKEKGVANRASAQMTVVLKKGASGWLIHGWTWTGPKPSPVK
jgi:ketosteroid isomerase-like protein